MKKIKLLLFFMFLVPAVFGQQDIKISDYLKKIEEGNAEQVLSLLPELKKSNPEAPSLIYLEGILQTDGASAIKYYSNLVQKHPKSTYSDAALYRLFSYYNAAGQQNMSDKYYSQLKTDYASSPYIKLLPPLVKENTVETIIYKYTIQAGAFSNNSNAENLRRKFIKAGYYTIMKDKNIGGTNFKVVYTGRFKTRPEAESFQTILNKEYGLKGIITQYQE